MHIDSKTQLTGLFGYPIRHTASPSMQNAAFEALNLPWLYLPLEVPSERLGEAVRGVAALGFRGFNVTIPNKQAVLKYLDEITPEAKLLGAVNTVQISPTGACRGTNTDGRGFIRSLRTDAAFEPRGKNFFIMGCGGAGCAIATQLALEGATRVFVCDAHDASAIELAEHIAINVPGARAIFVRSDQPSALADTLERVDVFVDATPLGLRPGEPTSIPLDLLRSELLVVDLVYNPPETPLLAQAKARGCHTLNGLGMLLFQGAEAFELWTNQPAPIDVMRRALHDAIADFEHHTEGV